jgi:hypothetical protein
VCVGDGSQVPHTRCTNCVVYNYECTYVESAKVRSADSIDAIILTNTEQLETESSEIVRHFASTFDTMALLSTFSYVESLEKRVAKLQQLLGKVRRS